MVGRKKLARERKKKHRDHFSTALNTIKKAILPSKVGKCTLFSVDTCASATNPCFITASN